MKKIIINVPVIGDRRFKKWTKTITNVDCSKTNGYAFEGDFIKEKAELEIGTYILAYGEEGSMKYHDPEIELFQITDEGCKSVFSKTHLSSKWTLDVRDEIANIVNSVEVKSAGLKEIEYQLCEMILQKYGIKLHDSEEIESIAKKIINKLLR